MRFSTYLLTLVVVLATTLGVVAHADYGPRWRARESLAPRETWKHLVFSDNFGGLAGSSPNPRWWNFDLGGTGWGSEEIESYTSSPGNAALDGRGHLVITARAERHTGREGITRQFTSARLQTFKKFQFRYGLVEARIKIPSGAGLLSQFWMLGTEAYRPAGWPASGEIDAMEVLGSQPNTVKGSLHGPWAWPSRGVTAAVKSATPLSEGFHVYGVEWRPRRINFLLDDAVYRTIRESQLPPGTAWPFRHPYFLLLDLVVGGTAAHVPRSATPFPTQMLVDWMRVWQ
jgi:beta-glucanase (GH16 family)